MFLECEERDQNNETGLKEGGIIENQNYSASIHYNDNDNYYSDTINISKLEIKHFYDNYNLVYSDTTKFQLFDFFSIHCLGLFERYDSIQHIKRRIN